MDFVYRLFIAFALALLFVGCVFSWKPSVSNSNVHLNDNTSLELPNEKEE